MMTVHLLRRLCIGGSRLEFISKFVGILVAVVIMFISPLVHYTNSVDDVIQTTVYEQVVNFKNVVCTQGKITQSEYLAFVNALDATGLIYDISITVNHQTVVPEFDENNAVVGTKNVDVGTYTDEILSKIYETDGVYEMSKGDTISVMVSNKTATIGQQMRIAFLHVPDYGNRITATAGGIVRDEFS